MFGEGPTCRILIDRAGVASLKLSELFELQSPPDASQVSRPSGVRDPRPPLVAWSHGDRCRVPRANLNPLGIFQPLMDGKNTSFHNSAAVVEPPLGKVLSGAGACGCDRVSQARLAWLPTTARSLTYVLGVLRARCLATSSLEALGSWGFAVMLGGRGALQAQRIWSGMRPSGTISRTQSGAALWG